MIVALVMLAQLMIVSVSFAAPPVKGSEIADPVPSGDTVEYTVRSGDTLYSIARIHGVSPQAIAQANGLQNLDNINVTQKLFIPPAVATGDYAPVVPPDPAPQTVVQPNNVPQFNVRPVSMAQYTVKTGDTLYSIAQRHGVSSQMIASANGILNPDSIYATQNLYIPMTGGGGYEDEDVSESSGTGPDVSNNFVFAPDPRTTVDPMGAIESVSGMFVIVPASTPQSRYQAGYGQYRQAPIVVRFSIEPDDFNVARNGPQYSTNCCY